jgi:hypothetical protein
MKGDLDAKHTEQQAFVCVATFLPLKRWSDLISFMILSRKVLKQIKSSEGIANYAVKADLPKKNFWTLSIWNDIESLKLFIPTEPHATAIKKFTEWAGESSAFVEWTSPSKEINWPEAMIKLENPTFYYKKK